MKKKKYTIFLILILFSMIFTSVFSLNVFAREYLDPEPTYPGADTNTFWEFNQSDIVGWNIKTFQDGSFESSEDYIYNITDFGYENLTVDEDEDISYFFYYVNLTQMYYNITLGSLKHNTSVPTIRTSILNYSFPAIAPAFESYLPNVPYFIPKNSSGIDFEYYATLIANGYNESGMIKYPNNIEVYGNEITISNSSGCYANLIYYNNGTLDTGEFNSSDSKIYNYTRIYDFDPSDDVQWGFDSGETVGWNHDYYIDGTLNKTEDLYYNISGFVYGLFGGDDYYYVNLSRYYFNLTESILKENKTADPLNSSVVTSYGLFPQWNGVPPYVPYFIPKNSTGLHLEYYAQLFANFLNEPDWLGYIKGPHTIDVQGFEITITNSSTDEYVRLKYLDNGTLDTGEAYFKDDDGKWHKHNYTRTFDFNPIDEVEWSVEVDDVLYARWENKNLKAEVVGFNDTHFEGFGVVQEVLANVSKWDDATNGWVLHKENETIGRANDENYVIFDEDMNPWVFRTGTNGTHILNFIKDLFKGEDITYSYGEYWGRATNQTSGDQLHLEIFPNQIFKYLKLTEHNITNYMMNSTIVNGEANFEIEPYNIQGFTINASISVNDKNLVMYAAFDNNPGVDTINNERLFMDILINNSGDLKTLNFTIEFDPTEYENLKFWWYNVSANEGDGAWKEILYETISSGKIFISMNHTSFYAISAADYTPPPSPNPPGPFNLTTTAGIPDTDGKITLNWTDSANAASYVLYTYSKNITEVNSSLTVVADGLTNKSYIIDDLTNGTYYYAVLAKNSDGQELSNSVKVDVSITPEGGDGDDDGTDDGDDGADGGDGTTPPEIPFGNSYLIFLLIGLLGILAYKKRDLIIK